MAKKFLSAIFLLVIFFVPSLLFSACGSSVDVSSVRSAEDTERKLNVEQYKPQPQPATKKEEAKPQLTSQEPTRKTSETKPTPITSTPESSRTKPAPSVTHSQSDTYLPDFRAFVNNKAEFSLNYDDNSKKAHYNIAVSNEKYSTDALMEEYIKLITSKYNFKLIGSDNDKRFPKYGFVYTSTGTVKQFTENIVGHKDKINLRITFFGGGRTGGIDEVVIRYADGINYTDTGDRTRYQIQEVKHNPQPSGSSSNNFDYPSGPEMRNAADEIKYRKCFRCNNGVIEKFDPRLGTTVYEACPDCNGTGRIELNW